MKNEKLDLKIDNICTELKRLIAIEYGEASVDELIKLSSFNKLNLTIKKKHYYGIIKQKSNEFRLRYGSCSRNRRSII